MPELVQYMHGGYGVTAGAWARKRARTASANMQLREGSAAEQAWHILLERGRAALEANQGIPLAATLATPSHLDPGSVTAITDASGVDGMGGYVFDAIRPRDVWLVSEKWPQDIQAALDRAAAGGAEGGLSMPATELFTAVAVPQAAATAGHSWPAVRGTTLFSVGDCAPAAHTGPRPQWQRPDARHRGPSG